MRPRPPVRPPPLGRALRRRPRVRLALTAALAATAGLGVTALARGAEQARAAWGRPVEVLVATEDLHPGDRVGPDNTRVEDRPEPLVPPDAVSDLDPSARAAATTYEGEVLRTARLAPGARSEVAARLSAGTRAVAVPIDPSTTPPLSRGDRVDVVVALAEAAAGDGPPGFAVATDVEVVHVSEQAATLAVPRDQAPRVAVALGQGAVHLALVGG